MPRTRPDLIERWQCDRCAKIEQAPVAAVEMIPGTAPAPPRLQGAWVTVSFQIVNPPRPGGAVLQAIPPKLFCYSCAFVVAEMPDDEPAPAPLGLALDRLANCPDCLHAMALHRPEPSIGGRGPVTRCHSPACQCGASSGQASLTEAHADADLPSRCGHCLHPLAFHGDDGCTVAHGAQPSRCDRRGS